MPATTKSVAAIGARLLASNNSLWRRPHSCNRERRAQSFESSSDHSMRQDVDEYKRRRGIVQFFLSADSMVSEPARGEVRKSWSR